MTGRPMAVALGSQVAGSHSTGCEKEEEEEERGEKRSETLVERDGASVDSHPVRSGRTADPVVTLKVPSRRRRPPPLSCRQCAVAPVPMLPASAGFAHSQQSWQMS